MHLQLSYCNYNAPISNVGLKNMGSFENIKEMSMFFEIANSRFKVKSDMFLIRIM